MVYRTCSARFRHSIRIFCRKTLGWTAAVVKWKIERQKGQFQADIPYRIWTQGKESGLPWSLSIGWDSIGPRKVIFWNFFVRSQCHVPAYCGLVGLVLAGLPVSWQPRPLWKITMATGREVTVTGTVPLQRDDAPS